MKKKPRQPLNYKIPVALFLIIILIAGGYWFFVYKIIGRVTTDHKILVLSPHFDDAVLSVGGLIAMQKVHPTVATFFTGKPNKKMSLYWDEMLGFNNSDEAIFQRTGENKVALEILGANIKNLNHLDYQYRSNLGNLDEKTWRRK